MSKRVNPEELAPATGFSHAVVVPPDHQIVYLAGQTALNADGVIVGEDVVAQFRQALGNLLAALGASGGAPSDLVTMTVYATDIEDYKTHGRAIGAVWRELVGTDYPAMAAVGVARLWDVEALVEVQAVAAIPPPRNGTFFFA